jgi:thiamine transport system ATP-binding protein
VSLVVEGVSVVIDGGPILTDVDLELGEREVVSVLGPSGSGKTTLLRVIAGLQEPSAGRVLVDGRDLTTVPTHRRGIGLMFQDHALFPHRDVEGNVGFGLRMARTPRAEIRRRVDEVLELVGLAGFASRRLDGLSGGERQRVALARALAPKPRVLLLDEPLGSLDRALRDRLLEDLAPLLHASGAAVLHVTHDQGEAFATGDRIAVMREGRLAQVDVPTEIWRRPVDAEVARIVGPVSLVPVRVENGRAIAPWGPLPVEVSVVPSEGMLVVRPDAVAVVDGAHPGGADADGSTLAGTVVGRTFRGDHVVARVALELAGGTDPVEIDVRDRAGTVPEVGGAVRLRLLGPPVVVPRADRGEAAT